MSYQSDLNRQQDELVLRLLRLMAAVNAGAVKLEPVNLAPVVTALHGTIDYKVAPLSQPAYDRNLQKLIQLAKDFAVISR